ncbi:hypothetical protein ACHQM5_028917 [Ranunculus cassubicifolius]
MEVLKAGSRPPWVGLGAAVWIQVASGSAYTFPLYSHSLKSVLGFNQQQLTMLGVANDIGENFGLLTGLACNKFPPWVVLSIGALTCFLGYGVLWLAITHTVMDLPYWLLWVALAIATNSSTWLSTAAIVTNMRNFPISRGIVAGILKGYSGISAAVFTEVYSAVLHSSSSQLLLFLTLGIPLICVLLMYFVKRCEPAVDSDSVERSHFIFVQVASIALGIYLLTTTTINDTLSLSGPISYVFVAVMILLLLAPLAVPVKMTLYPTHQSKMNKLGRANGSTSQLNSGASTPNPDNLEPLLNPSTSTTQLGSFLGSDDSSDIDMLLAEGEGAVKKKRRPRRGEDFSVREALVKADFWLLFLVYFVGVGTGVTVINNLAQIGIAQGTKDTTILLSLFSFSNFAGRLGGGVVSEHFVKTRTIPRTVWMTCTQVIMVLTYVMFALAFKGTLYIATALLGFCYGVQFSVMVPVASELFGLKNFAVIYNIMLMGNPLGALIFSGGLAGYVYDREVAKQQGLNLLHSSAVCLGPNCFRLTFLVLAGVCCIGTFLSVILTNRIKPVYEMLYAGGSFRLPQGQVPKAVNLK